MTAPPQMNGQMMPPPMQADDPADVTAALLHAALMVAQKAAGVDSGAEAKDFGQAALNFAQAVIVLDPRLSQGGTPLQHDVALEAARGQTQENVARIQGVHAVAIEQIRGDHALRLAQETAAAPTPAKKLKVTRDSNNRMTGIESEG